MPRLTQEQKTEIIYVYNKGLGESVSSIARHYNVSRKTIKYTVDPNARQADIARSKAQKKDRTINGLIEAKRKRLIYLTKKQLKQEKELQATRIAIMGCKNYLASYDL